jgi:hypothetical protein
MNKTAMAAVAILLVVLGGFGILASSYFHYANMKAAFETSIPAKKSSSEAQMAAFTSKAQDILAVARIDLAAQTSIIQKSNEARYGGEGSKAVLQFIKEQNFPINNEILMKLAVAVDDGRDEFKQIQDELLDQCRAYKFQLKKPYSGMWLRFANAPSSDFDMKYNCDVVSNAYTAEAMKTHRAEALDLKL